MITFNEYLIENLHKNSADVDYIYNIVYADFFKNIRRGIILPGELYPTEISSRLLPSRIAQQASKINPINITVGVFKDGSFYLPSNNSMQISFSIHALNFMKRWGIDGLNKVTDDRYEELKSQYNGQSIKATIKHELTHWLDDTLHNGFLHDRTIRAMDSSDPIKYMVKNAGDISGTSVELNAQIHSIQQYKRRFSKQWNMFTFDDIIKRLPSLSATFNALDAVHTERVRKYILHRMARENLLGDNMR